jgi:hypothetical protein
MRSSLTLDYSATASLKTAETKALVKPTRIVIPQVYLVEHRNTKHYAMRRVLLRWLGQVVDNWEARTTILDPKHLSKT